MQLPAPVLDAALDKRWTPSPPTAIPTAIRLTEPRLSDPPPGRGDPRRSARPTPDHRQVPLGGLGDCRRNERLPSTSGRATTCALEGS